MKWHFENPNTIQTTEKTKVNRWAFQAPDTSRTSWLPVKSSSTREFHPDRSLFIHIWVVVMWALLSHFQSARALWHILEEMLYIPSGSCGVITYHSHCWPLSLMAFNLNCSTIFCQWRCHQLTNNMLHVTETKTNQTFSWNKLNDSNTFTMHR